MNNRFERLNDYLPSRAGDNVIASEFGRIAVVKVGATNVGSISSSMILGKQ